MALIDGKALVNRDMQVDSNQDSYVLNPVKPDTVILTVCHVTIFDDTG